MGQLLSDLAHVNATGSHGREPVPAAIWGGSKKTQLQSFSYKKEHYLGGTPMCPWINQPLAASKAVLPHLPRGVKQPQASGEWLLA